MLASGTFRPEDERGLFTELVNETDLSWKHASYLVSNILSCWEETGDLNGILSYDRYDTEATREAIEVIQEANSSHGDLAGYTIDDDLDVAAIALEQFTALDRSILPDEYDVVDPFVEGTFDHPEFGLFTSATAIVETVTEAVSAENAEDVAIVMNRESVYPALVESALESAGIPYYGGPGFSDDTHIRTFLKLVRQALSSERLRLEDIQSVCSVLDIVVSTEHDRKRLSELDSPELEPIKQFCDSIADHSIDSALSAYEGWCTETLGEFRDELDQLGLLNVPVEERVLNDFEYYLQSVPIPIEDEQEGVLLAAAASAAYVDREVVFYLGLDTGWTHTIPDRPWIDASRKDRRNLQQFQTLLQNGSKQYYLVRDTEAGQPITPCLYFHDLFDAEFQQFSDLPHARYARQYRQSGGGFEKEAIDVDHRTVDTISQSALKTLVNCPRDYYFDQLVESPDRDYFEKGNLFHDFAEFYVNHPDVVESEEIGSIIEVMMNGMRPYIDETDLAVLESELRVGVEMITTYLDENPPESTSFDAYEQRGWGNVFAEEYGRLIDSQITEQWFENTDVGGRGVIDLIHTPSRLLDYKSGQHKSASEVVKNARIDSISDTPDFQALLYLTQHRREQSDERLDFRFFHFLESIDEAITDNRPLTLDDGVTTVPYHPTSFEEYIKRRETFETLREEGAGNCRKTFEKLDYETYRDVFDSHEFPATRDSTELVDTEFAEVLIERAKSVVGEYKYVDSGCKQALRQLLDIRSENYFVRELDEFERFLNDRLSGLNEWKTSRFPVETELAGEPNFDRVTHGDLILTDE
jgi:hypothetical protein